MLQQLLAELLDQLAYLLGIGVISQAQRQLHHRPVARIVGEMLDLAEWHGYQRSTMMAQLHRAN